MIRATFKKVPDPRGPKHGEMGCGTRGEFEAGGLRWFSQCPFTAEEADKINDAMNQIEERCQHMETI